MLKLRNLEHSLLNESIIKVLCNSRIITILDFLNEDVEKICSTTKLTVSQVLEIRNYIFQRYSAPVFNGLTLLKRHCIGNNYLNTGIESLNTMLSGGLPKGHITELCGLANSGKTQFCHQLAINCVKETENIVLYIDTKGDFSSIRIQQILDSHKKSYKEMAEIMFRIKTVRIWIMEELIELLQNIKSGALVLNKLSLIIIDSLPTLMFQHLGDESKIGLALLNKFVNYCRFLCRHLQLCVVCVNILTRWLDQDVELEDEKNQQQYSSILHESSYVEKQNRCLGKYWQQIPYQVLFLELKQLQDKKEFENIVKQLTISVLGTNNKVSKQCLVTLSTTGVS